MLTGAAPFYILPRFFLPRDAAYEAFFAIAGTLNFLALYWILRRLGVQAPVAALAAFVFAFGMHTVQHTVHSQLFLQCWGVLCLYCVMRFMQAPTRGLVFWPVLLLGLQTLSSPYCGIFYLIGAGLLNWDLCGDRAWDRRKNSGMVPVLNSSRWQARRLWRWLRQRSCCCRI